MIFHRVVLTGGGTGGHIYPAMAVAEVLKQQSDIEDILYIGAKGHSEERLAKEAELRFIGLSVSGLPRKISSKLLSWPIEFLSAVMQARAILQEFKPTVVLGTGGYASAAPLVAALSLKIPIAIHEPDAYPGIANKMIAPWSNLASLGMEKAADRINSNKGKIVVNGNPVRQGFVQRRSRQSACVVLGLNPEYRTILITGGSQGAQAINNTIANCLKDLLSLDPPVQIIHQVGEKNLQEYKESLDKSIRDEPRYYLRAYFEDLSLPLACADIAIVRAGAMTIAELSVMGVPAIFIPYPYAAANHQFHNAKYLESKGAALLIPQANLNSQLLMEKLTAILSNPHTLADMSKSMLNHGKPQAAHDLTMQILELSTKYQLDNLKAQGIVLESHKSK